VALTISHVAEFDPGAARSGLDVECSSGDLSEVEAVTALVHAVYGGQLQAWQQRMHRALSRSDYCLLLAFIGGEPVGYGKANWCEPRGENDQAPAGMFLTGLVVAPAWRRRGIGEELIRRRLTWVWLRDQAAWFFTSARNRASLALHARLGFIEAGRAASYLGKPFDGGVGVLMRADPPASGEPTQ